MKTSIGYQISFMFIAFGLFLVVGSILQLDYLNKAIGGIGFGIGLMLITQALSIKLAEITHGEKTE